MDKYSLSQVPQNYKYVTIAHPINYKEKLITHQIFFGNNAN